MVRHIVLFKVKEEHKEEVLALVEQFKTAKGEIECLSDFMIGEDFLHSSRSYDFGLIADFKTKEDLDTYSIHPIHVPFKTRMAEISEKVAACDFEF